MDQPSSVFFASPLHDPEGRLTEMLKEYGPKLLRIYAGNAVVSVSPTTSPGIISILKSQRFIVNMQSEKTSSLIGNNYLHAIKTALYNNAQTVHQVDFDRALHWVKRFPRELRDIVEILHTHNGLTSFVRTSRSFETHPQVQRATESVVNAIASEAAGIDVDIMSGSFGFENKLAQKILQEAQHKDFGIYANFLRIAIKNKFLISTIEVEGLEWETPDQFQDSIRKEGYLAWLQEFESLPEWKKRVALIDKSTDVLTGENS